MFFSIFSINLFNDVRQKVERNTTIFKKMPSEGGRGGRATYPEIFSRQTLVLMRVVELNHIISGVETPNSPQWGWPYNAVLKW